MSENYIFNIEICRDVLNSEDESPELIDTLLKTENEDSDDMFGVTKQINFAVLPEESTTSLIDSYLYESFNKDNAQKLSYIDLLLYKTSNGNYLPVDITHPKNASSDIAYKDKTFYVTLKLMDEAFSSSKCLTTKFKSTIYSSYNKIILTKTQNGHYLLRFEIKQDSDYETYVLGYSISSDATTANIIMLTYSDVESDILECAPNKLYYEDYTTYATKYGYYWDFNKDEHCLWPSVLNALMNSSETFVIESGRTVLENVNTEDITTICQTLKIYPFYFNRAITIPKSEGILEEDGKKLIYFDDYRDSSGNIIECTSDEIYKYNYISESAEAIEPSNLVKFTMDMVIPAKFKILHHYKTDSSKFKFTISPSWTSETDSEPVAMEVYSECYDSDGEKIEDDDMLFLCLNEEDETLHIYTSDTMPDFDFNNWLYPLKMNDKFIIYCDKYNRDVVKQVKLTLTPIMVYGKLEQLSREILVDTDKIMTGDCDFTAWSFNYELQNEEDGDNLQLTYGYNLYLSDTMHISEAYIDFYNTLRFLNTKTNTLNTLPDSFLGLESDYRLDIMEKTSASGIYTDTISGISYNEYDSDVETKVLNRNLLYLCRIFIKVAVGQTSINHTYFRYLFTNSDFNKHYADVLDFNEIYLDFSKYAQLNIDPGYNIEYDQDVPLVASFEEFYSKTKFKEVSTSVDLNPTVFKKTTKDKKTGIETPINSQSISVDIVEGVQSKGWSFDSEYFTITPEYKFCNSVTYADLDDQTPTISYVMSSGQVSSPANIVPDGICESVYSYLYRTGSYDDFEKVWGFNPSTLQVSKCTSIVPNHYNWNRKSDNYEFYGQGGYEDYETLSGVINISGWNEINIGESGSWNYENMIKNAPAKLGMTSLIGFRPNFLSAYQVRSSHSLIVNSESFPPFFNTSAETGSILLNLNLDTFNSNNLKINIDSLAFYRVLGEYIFYYNNSAYQTNIYFGSGKGGSIALFGSGVFSWDCLILLGQLMATKLSLYYFYRLIDANKCDDEPIHVYKSDDTVYARKYNIADNTNISVKKYLTISAKNSEDVAVYQKDDTHKYYMLNYDKLVYYNGVNLYELNNAIKNHKEINLDSPNLKFEPYDSSKTTTDGRKLSEFNERIEDPTFVKDDFIKLCSSDKQGIILHITPFGERKYFCFNKEELQANYYYGKNTLEGNTQSGTKRIYTWYKESVPLLLRFNQGFTQLLSCGIKHTDLELDNYSYLDSEKNSNYEITVKPRFSSLNQDNLFTPTQWQLDNCLNGTLMLNFDTDDDGWCRWPAYGFANENGVHWF